MKKTVKVMLIMLLAICATACVRRNATPEIKQVVEDESFTEYMVTNLDITSTPAVVLLEDNYIAGKASSTNEELQFNKTDEVFIRDELVDINNQTIDISKGRFCIILMQDFCKHCKKEHTELKENGLFNNEYTIVEVFVNSTADGVRENFE